jgi:hypothetical protein
MNDPLMTDSRIKIEDLPDGRRWITGVELLGTLIPVTPPVLIEAGDDVVIESARDERLVVNARKPSRVVIAKASGGSEH